MTYELRKKRCNNNRIFSFQHAQLIVREIDMPFAILSEYSRTFTFVDSVLWLTHLVYASFVIQKTCN